MIQDPLHFKYWLHGGEPESLSETLEIWFESDVCRARLTRISFNEDANSMQTDRFESILPSGELETLLDKIAESPLFKTVDPSEIKPAGEDIEVETWELSSPSGNLQSTFYAAPHFPDYLEAPRSACINLMNELEEHPV